MITINCVQYQWANVTIPMHNKKDIALVKMAFKKGINLLYGVGQTPIAFKYDKPNIKINEKSLNRLKQIDIDTYRFAINQLL